MDDGNWLQRLFAPVEVFFRNLEEAVQPSAAVTEILEKLDAWAWGLFLIFLLVGTGLFFAWKTRFIQLRKLGHAIALVRGKYDNPADEGDISHFQALATALSATIGTGNIAGVATAIALGGPGAVFWMWVTGLLGSGIKYASCTLGMKYRVMNADGTASGGPMYYLEHGLGKRWLGAIIRLGVFIGSILFAHWILGQIADSGRELHRVVQWLVYPVVVAAVNVIFMVITRIWLEVTAPAAQALEPALQKLRFHKWLAVIFAFFAAVASFGIGNMIQANSMTLTLGDDFGIPRSLSGLVIAVLAGMVIIGGIKRIGRFTAKLTPIMAVIYVTGAAIVLVKNAALIPDTFGLIFYHAFNPTAATGGFVGSAIALTVRQGVAKGVFSNESGLGSAPIAHAAAKTKEPVREGLVAMIGPFVDTLLICTMTALVIISTGAYTMVDAGTGEQLTSSLLTKRAFEIGMTGGGWIVTVGLMLFAFSTIIGWSYYGDRSVGYLFGLKGIRVYRWIYICLIPLGAAMKVGVMWTISDITNGLMAFPNLVALIFLSPVVMELTRDYFSREQKPYR